MAKNQVGNIKFSTWNVCGNGTPEEIDKLLHKSSEQQSSHIVCIQQANLPVGDLPHYKWLCSGQQGSAVAIKKTSSLQAETFEQVCEQICVAHVVTEDKIPVYVISCYIPPSDDYASKDLWQKLVSVVKKVPANAAYVIAGDFNAKIGRDDCYTKDDCITKGMIGPKLFHNVSDENGVQLRKCILSWHATVLTTYGTGRPVPTYKDDRASQRSYIMGSSDRIPFHTRTLLQDTESSWYSGYKSALISKCVRIKVYEKYESVLLPKVGLASWNVHGASPAAVDKSLSELNIPVVCVQEFFLTSDKDLENLNYTWFTSKKLWGKNVAILVKNSFDITLSDFVIVNEYLCIGTLSLGETAINVICCSMPSHKDAEKFRETTLLLMEMMRNIPEETMYVVAGDFNTDVSYTLIEDTLVYKDGDENGVFVEKIMKDFKLELPYTHSNWTCVSEKGRRNSSITFTSQSCLMKYTQKYVIRWVPFFESGVVCLHLLGDETSPEPDNILSCPENTGTKEEEENIVEHIDGFVYKTKRFCKLKKFLSNFTVESQAFINQKIAATREKVEKSDLPLEVHTKYKNLAIPIDELLRILGDDFTLFHGYTLESTILKGHFTVLTASFENLNRGGLFVELIDVLDKTASEVVKKLVKFRWNGIVVHEEENKKFATHKKMINQGQTALLSKLGQHCFTVKARGSFYNGLPPKCEDEDQLKQLLRVMKMSDFPRSVTFDDIKQRIFKFLAEKPEYELVFGPEFYEKFQEPIKKLVINLTSKKCGVRLFKSSSDSEHFDNVSVFLDRSPREVRKMLMKTPEHRDIRFQLVPPCGPERDYFDWLAEWTEKIIPEEFYQPFLKEETPTVVPSDVVTTNGNAVPEEKKEANPEKLINVESTHGKHRVGFVERKVRRIGGWIHRIVKLHNVTPCYTTAVKSKGIKMWTKLAREESDLPQSVVEKLRETPPPIEELARILGDEFTLYYGFDRESCAISNTQNILAESFEATGRGGIMTEHIEVYKAHNLVHKQIVKFKWNGICIHTEEGPATDGFKIIGQRGQAALVDKLGQHFYTVKAKMSFFNSGLYPVCADTDQLSTVFKTVKLSDFPAPLEVAELRKFILNFFSQETDAELVFGSDFSVTEHLGPLKKFASEQGLNYRFMKSAEGLTSWDSVALFNRLSPLKIRDRLINIPDHQDLKFFLVPPCEFFSKPHMEWIKGWAAENFAEEFKLISEEEKKPKPPSVDQKKPKPPSAEQKKPKPPSVGQPKQTPKQRPAASSKRKMQTSNIQSPKSRVANNRRSNQQISKRRRDIHSLPSRSRLQSPRSVRNNQRNEPAYREDNSLYSRSERYYPPISPARQYHDHYLAALDAYSPYYRPEDSYAGSTNSRPHRAEDYYAGSSNSRPQRAEDYYAGSSSSQLHRADDYYAGSSNSQPRRADDYSYYGESSYSQTQNYGADNYKDASWSSQQNSRTDRVSRKRDWDQMDLSQDVRFNQPKTSGDYLISSLTTIQDPYVEEEIHAPETKRPRESKANVTTPRWDDIGPLLIVWPVTVRSELEKDPRKILEANFPTDIELEQSNKVAVHITLPLRNGRDKQYCLCVGNGVYNAAKTALDMLVKRSSIIKHTVGFLPPDGQVPNFIRYNIPCQTNPRTYIILSYMDTGPLTLDKIDELLTSFRSSLNEDLFFDKNIYTHDMKLALLDRAPKFGLKVRHFGTDSKLQDRYVCVYKTKPKEEVLEEVLKMRDFHPKYKLTADKLPPRLGLNIF
ncbi:uncharacterized protein LOC129002303 isoform X3 [Macrosteles quadrilineatus]|uniref:uncharacterized protein LOC129002303 isoform X3 n=1 Tax=Macrosteles quadrilineatus TaxID=74068 RepID=UPI0023E1DDCF|nr:uncharacterized protein LOC129002303 isoform X3 [Macrosteles quadrilineatus]